MINSTPTGSPSFTDDGHDADVALLTRVRAGQVDAYGPLFDRHHSAALALARRLTGSNDEAEDVAATAFDRVIRAIENGKGPTEAFRPYLMTAVRRTAWRRTEQTRREHGIDDDETFDSLLPPSLPEGGEDTDQLLAVEAFKELPERWQLVLWHTLVEDMKPAEVAPLLGLSPNATAALAVRAREGLRESYLQRHLARDVPDDCRFTVDRLGARVRGNLGKRDRAKVASHLETCERCQELERELGSVNGLMRSVIGPAVLGIGVADYQAGWELPTDLSSARGISFRSAAAVGGVAAIALTLLGLSADVGSDVAARPVSTIAGPSVTDALTVSALVDQAVPITPVASSGCDGPAVPIALPTGTTITAARAVVTDQDTVVDSGTTGPSDPTGNTALHPTALSEAEASDLQPAGGVTVVVTDRGVCGNSLAEVDHSVGLLLSIADDQGSLTFAIVNDLLADVVDVLRSTVGTATATLPVDPGDLTNGALPDLTSPTVTIPRVDNGPQPPQTPGLPIGPDPSTVLPDPGTNLPVVPRVADLVDRLVPGGLL